MLFSTSSSIILLGLLASATAAPLATINTGEMSVRDLRSRQLATTHPIGDTVLGTRCLYGCRDYGNGDKVEEETGSGINEETHASGRSSKETPAKETPAEGKPTEETPASERETPSRETSPIGEETPSEETPAKETPASGGETTEETNEEEIDEEETDEEDTDEEDTDEEDTDEEDTDEEDTDEEEADEEETHAKEPASSRKRLSLIRVTKSPANARTMARFVMKVVPRQPIQALEINRRVQSQYRDQGPALGKYDFLESLQACYLEKALVNC